MTMRKRFVPAVVLSVLLLLPTPAAAWGFEAHKFIVARVVALLPAEIRPYFEKHRAEFVERSIDPDLWRNAGYGDVEAPHHFVDMDAYGAYPFKDLPHEYDAVVKKHGIDTVRKNGTLPWRTDEMYKKLVEAFTQKAGYSRDNIRYYASWVAHYVSDAHVPFHASLNHDGQLTNQWGIHSRFETEAFERFQDRLKVVPGSLITVKDSKRLMFETLTKSFTYVKPILDADLEAVKGRDTYDDGYFTLFFSKVQPIMEKRLADSIVDTASLIVAAWIEAGRPAVPLESPRTPRKVRRQ